MLTHIAFGEGDKTLAILIPQKDLNKASLVRFYIEPLEMLGIARESIIAFPLEQNKKGKAPAVMVHPCLESIGKIIDALKITTVMCCDSTYFKALCKVRKTEQFYGYAQQTIWSGVDGFISLNYKALFFNPENKVKIDFSLKAVAGQLLNTGGVFTEQVLIDCQYPRNVKDIKLLFEEYSEYPKLTCDIETYSLRVNKAGLATIAFAHNIHTGFCFHVTEKNKPELIKFFQEYKGKLIYHGSTFDIKILIWELFMGSSRDYIGMLSGLHRMFRDIDDTKIIAYLALNSTAGPGLGLKELAFEYTGNYALDDINDITKIDPEDLLIYNMTDACATWYVHDKYMPEVQNTQKEIYEKVFLPSLKTITQMELCGVPINLGQVLATEHELDDIANTHYQAIMDSPVVEEFTEVLREQEATKANKKLKILVKTRDDFLSFQFNPNSHTQLAKLLHDHLRLPILGKTDGGAPSTGNKILKNLVDRLTNTKKGHIKVLELIEHFIAYADVVKILNTFIPAFKNNSITKDGWEYLHGSFNLGAVKSGRLSSSDPNLMNIPSTGTVYATPVKSCIQAPPPDPCITKDILGWLLIGADYIALEDMVSALQTKDPNKLKIYTDGYDGHCLRSYTYFSDQMPDIDPNSVESINSIAQKYPELRQLSKSPTFLLTYMGTYIGLMKQFGFSKEAAQEIEKNYHDLYQISDQWVMDRIQEASKTGYVELAFGLRLRTPMLPQIVIQSHDSMPFAAHKEMKTAGNALGQSYGLLNSHSANLFMQRVWDSKYATDVLPVMQIHDAQYYMIRNSMGCLKWVNDNLIECMEWNELEAIQHPTVKLGANLEIYYPDWSQHIDIPNKASYKALRTILRKAQK